MVGDGFSSEGVRRPFGVLSDRRKIVVSFIIFCFCHVFTQTEVCGYKIDFFSSILGKHGYMYEGYFRVK